MAPKRTYDLKLVSLRQPHSDAIRLSVREVMENDGRWCGPEFGWITLDEMVRYGRGVDTDPEDWETSDQQKLCQAMWDYWDIHPEMSEDYCNAHPEVERDGDYDPPTSARLRIA